ncbi:hypothetical protein [uncultured Desulfosarcina sp.]|uniref:hypothetical protein n=1 Tax=uncultured Desulfosarcina sp. TaxID=218289 RepID=UPI0029C7E400|nr:hypothetical protein [uncultured Desulfosarcina sp.]
MAALKIIGGANIIKILAITGARIVIGIWVAGTPMTGATMAIAKEILTAATVYGDNKRIYPTQA